MKDHHQNTQSHHLKEFPAEEILSLTRRGSGTIEVVVGKATFRVSLQSQRLRVFAKSASCACCGLEGHWMCLDVQPSNPDSFTSPHFNLYAHHHGKMILMTKDHVLAKASGGQDKMGNYQTKCVICNSIKEAKRISLEELREHPDIKGRASSFMKARDI